ncbi:hypothetical protein SAMN05446935_10486 [Burkholderia sp. YR290]|nr:hypothetical protein SAMN05446934_7932 [Paraburkholderia hospita]SOE91152.1 hypothetical protein SAMN05446935_10486 [Burkholderia sp. YR290]
MQPFVKRRRTVVGQRFALAIWVVAALVLGAIDVAVFFWTPAEGGSKSPWAVPAITFFVAVAVYAALTELMRRRVVVEMRGEPPAVSRSEGPDRQSGPAEPLPRLRVDVLTTEQILAGAMHESPGATRARRIFDRSVALHRDAVWWLLTANLVIGLVGQVVRQPFPLAGLPLTILAGAPLALVLIGALGRRTGRTTIHHITWIALHGAWLFATCFVCASYIVGAASGRADARAGAWVLAASSVLAIVVHGLRLHATHRRLWNEVTATPPVRLLFLWVFGDGMRINSLLSGIGAVWRCIGPLQFLQGGGMIGMGADVFRHLAGRALVANDVPAVDARIASFVWHADPRWCMYATNTILCGDRSWRHALDRMLETDLVLMDLCGFSSANAGCVYEIGCIAERIDVSRAVFLVDTFTDMSALQATLEAAWARMSHASPNRRDDCSAIRLFKCEPESPGDGQVHLRGIERNAECLVDLLCANVR